MPQDNKGKQTKSNVVRDSPRVPVETIPQYMMANPTESAPFLYATPYPGLSMTPEAVSYASAPGASLMRPRIMESAQMWGDLVRSLPQPASPQAVLMIPPPGPSWLREDGTPPLYRQTGPQSGDLYAMPQEPDVVMQALLQQYGMPQARRGNAEPIVARSTGL